MRAPLVVILAGGEGRRIGGDKPLRRLGGERLVDRAARLARHWSDDVRIAVRSRHQLGKLDIPELIDNHTIEGPLAGLHSALSAARGAAVPAVLTLPCDAPFLPANLAQGLQAAIGNMQAAVAATGLQLHPTCALWRADCVDALDEHAARGQRSLIGFAEVVGFTTVEWDARHFFNVNSARDLAEAELLLASEIERLD